MEYEYEYDVDLHEMKYRCDICGELLKTKAIFLHTSRKCYRYCIKCGREQMEDRIKELQNIIKIIKKSE